MSRHGTVYRSGAALRFNPVAVRATTFRPARLGRRGVREEDVREFLLAVAAHLELVYRELAAATDENDRLKTALRDWQTTHNSCLSPAD